MFKARFACVAFMGLSLGLGPASDGAATQFFYIDFDSVKESFDATGPGPGIPPADEIYDYAPEQRAEIVGYLNTRYDLHDIIFFEGLPDIPGSGSVITLNKGFGAGAEGVDFRNLDDDDSASVNTISIFKFLGLTAGDWTDPDVSIATANIIGHEAGHLMGARHHDAYGPIGSGIGTFPSDFLPGYPGPVSAPETPEAFQSLHAGGASFSFLGLTSPKYVSERTAFRLEFAKPFSDALVDTDLGDNHTVETAQFVDRDSGFFTSPYPFRDLPEPSSTFFPEAASPFPTELTGIVKAVVGTLEPDGGDGFLPDYYKFFGYEGEQWTIEVMSKILEGGDRYPDFADPAVILLDEFGGVIPYYGADAVNDDDDDGELGATLIDVILPETGFYVIEVVAASEFLGTGKTIPNGGGYELYLYTRIPEPGTLSLLGLGGLALLKRRRRA